MSDLSVLSRVCGSDADGASAPAGQSGWRCCDWRHAVSCGASPAVVANDEWATATNDGTAANDGTTANDGTAANDGATTAGLTTIALWL